MMVDMETNNDVTADTITTEQLEGLRDEAARHGDDMQVAYCQLALGNTPKIALNTTSYGARIVCADAINAARAMDDSEAV